jgi:hypothetical protein
MLFLAPSNREGMPFRISESITLPSAFTSKRKRTEGSVEAVFSGLANTSGGLT